MATREQGAPEGDKPPGGRDESTGEDRRDESGEFEFHTGTNRATGVPDAIEFVGVHKSFGSNHVLQGLNMGLRDAADIAQIAGAAIVNGEDAGSDAVLQRYERDRSADIFSRTFAVDMANRTLLSDFLPVQSLRAAGLHALNAFGPIRRMAMREGLSPSWRAN